MQHRKKRVSSLLPANENPATTVHPAVNALDNPATCLEAGAFLDGLGFLAARTYVRGEAELLRKLTDFLVVVALVEAETLRLLSALR